MKPIKWLFAASLGLFLLPITACIPSMDATPRDLSTATPAVIPTETIVWFPATATWTPFPTVQPSATTIPFPGIGEQIFSDDFSEPIFWTNASTAGDGGNSVIVSDKRLFLAVNNSPAYLASVYKGLILTDFYAETTVNVNRCTGDDAYGMLFRAGSEAYAYRLALNCIGQVRVDRLRAGETYPLQNWEASGDVPPGAPGEVKLGVWTAGVELRFFLNDHYQFTVLDPLFKSGSIGYFAESQSALGMNVGFSDLVVNSVAYVSPTPTPTPSKTPLPSRTPRPTP